MTDTRIDPPFSTPERPMLESWLDYHATKTRPGDAISVRWILVHMIEEYARHNGHADFLRQCIDGATGD